MDGSKNHARAHLHIDYNTDRHTASYAIDDGTRLAGTLSSKYEKPIKKWIETNKIKLLQAWEDRHSGRNLDAVVAELQATPFR